MPRTNCNNSQLTLERRLWSNAASGRLSQQLKKSVALRRPTDHASVAPCENSSPNTLSFRVLGASGRAYRARLWEWTSVADLYVDEPA